MPPSSADQIHLEINVHKSWLTSLWKKNPWEGNKTTATQTRFLYVKHSHSPKNFYCLRLNYFLQVHRIATVYHSVNSMPHILYEGVHILLRMHNRNSKRSLRVSIYSRIQVFEYLLREKCTVIRPFKILTEN